MAENKRFTKIKFDGSKVTLGYEIPRKDGDPDEFTVFCADLPAPEFDQALQALAVDVAGICEMPDSDAVKIKVRGVTLTWAHDIMGACITAMKSLKTAQSPLVLNTPHLPSESYSDTDCPVLRTDCIHRLDRLALEAERYLNGERAQGSLLSVVDDAGVAVPVGEAIAIQ